MPGQQHNRSPVEQETLFELDGEHVNALNMMSSLLNEARDERAEDGSENPAQQALWQDN